MTARGARRLLIAFVSVTVLLLGAWLVLLREVPQPQSNDPSFIFNHGSIGNETTQGLPYWIWRVLPTVFADHLPSDQRGWAAIGVVWRPGEPLPIGFSQKTLGVIPRVSPNCAFCHQGSYRLYPEDPETIVSGAPGTRINIQGFVRFLIAAGQDDRFNSNTIMAEINRIYDMPLWERMLYRYLLIPATRSALKGQAADLAWTTTRPDWGIGRVDPFNLPKYTFLGLQDDGTIGTSDMMSVWDINSAAPTAHRRFSVHWDGLQTDVEETMVSGSIGDGMTRHSYAGARENLDVIFDFIGNAMPPDSPFSPDLDPGDPYYVPASDVVRGEEIYEGLCADCHEPSGQRFRTPISITELGTDRHRMDMWSYAARQAYSDYEEGYYWGFTHFQKSNGYLAVPLTGLWMRGPYLHNGSVPHLRALLTPPKDRPTNFWRGSDLVDPENGGYVTDNSADPYRFMWQVDTSVPGNANTGHTWGTDLGQADKQALLAYLKTL
ncbi:MAG: hypothetical protein LJE68_16410 [Rhodobacter sp.]|nr:hypothetical protein [Rhodobacter sp.]